MKSALKPLEARIMHRFENGASSFYVSVLSAGSEQLICCKLVSSWAGAA
jgi:hypothetical protein